MQYPKGINVYDNFLKEDEYEPIRQYFLDYRNGFRGHKCPWYLNNGVIKKNDGLMQLISMAYFRSRIINHDMYELLSPIYDIIDPMALYRIKANLTLSNKIQETNPEDMFHTDSDKCIEGGECNMVTGIYYINTNDGYTLFKTGDKVESVANRFVTFPCHYKHTGVPASTNGRMVINYNWYMN
ncbi:hypothetical protein PSSM2_054 [Prochlorococcus phage P-SSM2]|uniref:Prolyl 4-hydroxylase alpha subunit Fe(2+) 2OG dioxygenase domain-containing protein n=1 Tax=Prochlorococcus phage P-SSM2 TaxID=268746 RepID=Q58MV0_BPPRM|nr:DNA endonuclease V [Prochlorococcus phage P-SSM2]AAX44432.1 hypothetical protein PSSM2_054 [Prochlorococcus phage P-SSM2]ACY75930.1 conserved hypothetical protein [Prochlorococcus phage P-SSM2]